MDSDYADALQRNIYKFYSYRIFTKRAFLPLIAIYAVNVAKVSLFDLGIIAAITAATQLVLEIPSGYIADRFGHKRTLVLGSVIIAVSPLAYIIWPDFLGVLLGSALFFGGIAFHSGTIEAFMHETLLELNREKELARILGLSQTIGLIGNSIIISLVPLTYVWDVRLPFIIGAALSLIELIIMLTLTTPVKTHKEVSELEQLSFRRLLQAMRSSNNHILFLLLGVATAVSNKIPEYRELLLQNIGVPVVVLGFILAATSIVGALFSYYVHQINEKMPARTFYLFDILVLTILTILIGLATDPIFAVVLFILVAAYGRARKVSIQTYILEDSPTRNLKATYMSLLSFSSSLNSIWVPLLLGYLIGLAGLSHGHAMFGSIMLVLLVALFLLHRSRQKALHAHPA